MDLVRIKFEIVEFFFRPLSKREVEVLSLLRVVFTVKSDPCLGRASVEVAEGSERVLPQGFESGHFASRCPVSRSRSHRPAIRFEVANVNMPVGSQATLRVGHVVVAGG